ncbi:substrate-binding periplasmic protein [Thalassotalea sp. PLHSN55]|uniref:substrate-binding periplasmic protein n=1 Tax=Thalassotalea sp. PLHSN55 TaxID=3435888 RepID=UPI003F865F11
MLTKYCYRVSLSVFLIAILMSLFVPQVQAKKLRVAYGNSLAPWVMQETDNGILLDIMNEAMLPLGYEIEAVYFPYARRIKSYQTNKVDAVCDINQKNINIAKLQGHFSDVIYAFKNYAYTLEKNNFNFTNIAQLSAHSVLSWQGAKAQLGDEYFNMAQNNPFYSETFDQKSQVKMLLKGRVEVIQLDHQIFEYYLNELITKEGIDPTIKVKRFALFGENPNGFFFNTEQARDDFVQQIKLMKADGRFDAIFQRYMRKNSNLGYAKTD